MRSFWRRCVCFLRRLGRKSQNLHVRICEKEKEKMNIELSVQRSDLSQSVLLSEKESYIMVLIIIKFISYFASYEFTNATNILVMLHLMCLKVLNDLWGKKRVLDLPKNS